MRRILDISSDKIALYGNEAPVYLEREGVDVQLGAVLVAEDKQFPISECLVLNGPGGFTNLRVGTLALNLLKVLKKNQISFFSLSKIELYQLFYMRGWIDRYGAIYLGQKFNVWLWDFEQNTLLTACKKSELLSFDQQYSGIFVDQVYQTDYFDPQLSQLKYSFDQEGCTLQYKDHLFTLAWEDLLLHPVEKLEPKYMIEPNVS